MSRCGTRRCSCGSCGRMTAIVHEVTPLTAEEVENALEHIRNGWVKHVLQTEYGQKVCSIGALNKARYGQAEISNFTTDNAMIAHDYTLSEFVVLSGIHGTIHHWNDAPERTQDEVEDAFITVAKKLRDQGR